jgi:hypothetical protein
MRRQSLSLRSVKPTQLTLTMAPWATQSQHQRLIMKALLAEKRGRNGGRKRRQDWLRSEQTTGPNLLTTASLVVNP